MAGQPRRFDVAFVSHEVLPARFRSTWSLAAQMSTLRSSPDMSAFRVIVSLVVIGALPPASRPGGRTG